MIIDWTVISRSFWVAKFESPVKISLQLKLFIIIIFLTLTFKKSGFKITFLALCRQFLEKLTRINSG